MSEIVSLKPGPNGGLDVPIDAYNLMFELSDRDLILATESTPKNGETMLRIKHKDGTRPVFSEDERARIVKWKPHLIALIAYVPPEL